MWQIVVAVSAAGVAAYEILEDYFKKKNLLSPPQRAAADAALKSDSSAQVVRTAQALEAAGKPVAAVHLIHQANVAIVMPPVPPVMASGTAQGDLATGTAVLPSTPMTDKQYQATLTYKPDVLQTTPMWLHASTASAPKSGDWGVTVRAPARPAGWVVDILPVQKALILVGALDAKSPTGQRNDDGVRGKGTDHALRFWQVNHGLNTSNGIADQATADALGKAANGVSLNPSGASNIAGEPPPRGGKRRYGMRP